MFKFIQSIDSTPLGKRYHYKTLIHGKLNGYEIITDDKENVIRYTPWVQGVKQGLEYNYNDRGDVDSFCPYFEGFKHGIESVYDNKMIKEVIYWDYGTKLSYEVCNKFGAVEKFIDFVNKTGYEYYPNGQPKIIFTFDEHEYSHIFEEWYRKDGLLMTKKEIDESRRKMT